MKRIYNSNQKNKVLENLCNRDFNPINKEQTKLYQQAKDLIASGADVNHRDAEGSPVVFKLIENGQNALLRLFIKKGADLTLTDKNGENVLEHAARLGRQALLKTLLKNETVRKTIRPDYQGLADIAMQYLKYDVVAYLKRKSSTTSGQLDLDALQETRKRRLTDLSTELFGCLSYAASRDVAFIAVGIVMNRDDRSLPRELSELSLFSQSGSSKKIRVMGCQAGSRA